MIAYKGSTDSEDVLLNLAGTLAFFVAFVPSNIPETPGCQQIVPTAAEKWDAIENNVGALIAALVIAFGIVVFVYFVDKSSRAETSLWGNRLRVISAIVLAVFVAAFFFVPELFEAAAHWVAAILIFVIIGGVVFINAYLVGNQDKQDRVKRERFHRSYRVIAWAMVGSLLAALVVAALGKLGHLQGGSWNIPVFALESALLLEFAVFWALQTVELWNYADRNALIPAEKKAMLPPL
jgi:putative Mn2+ efflux pump MntP